jgi:hypothetical protein
MLALLVVSCNCLLSTCVCLLVQDFLITRASPLVHSIPASCMYKKSRHAANMKAGRAGMYVRLMPQFTHTIACHQSGWALRIIAFIPAAD